MKQTDRDYKILNFIEQNKGITISQCSKIFYHGHKFAYQEAWRRLKQLETHNYIQHYTFPNTNELIYCFDNTNTKAISYHSFTILNFYAELYANNAKVLFYKNELKFSTGKKCDAYFEIEFNNSIIPIILEIDFTHNTSIEKYEDIFNTNELQNSFIERFGENYNIFPLVVIITYATIRKYNGFINYTLLPFNFNDLLNKVLISNECYIPMKLSI